MLSQRQKNILGEFYSSYGDLITASNIAKRFNISRRTAQNEISEIKKVLKQQDYAIIESAPSKGSRLVVIDEKKFKEAYLTETIKVDRDVSERIRDLCINLLWQHRQVSKEFLERELFVSSSTLTSDLNRCSKIFHNHDLRLKRDSKGIELIGKEKNQRKCLIQLGNLQQVHPSRMEEFIHSEVERVIVNTLMKNHYNVSEPLLQDLLIQVELSVKRSREGFYIENFEVDPRDSFEKEFNIAAEIYRVLGQRFQFREINSEILDLSIKLRGIVTDDSNNYVSEFVEKFMDEALEEVESEFDIDFTQDFELRYSLSLHIMSLLTRVRYSIQNDNKLLDEIKRSFPLAFDIAAYVGLKLQEKIDQEIIEGEIGYLAIYFNQHLSNVKPIKSKQRILIVTSLKKSEDILLRQRFAMWFANQIQFLKTVNVDKVEQIDLENYDVIFSTEQSDYMDQIGAILISYYPKETEYSKIKLAIDGFKNKEQILSLFSPKRFIAGEFKSKDEVMKKLIELSQPVAGQQTVALENAVLLRENLGSSYFGNHIALPHPVSPFSLQTFVTVALIKNNLMWDEDGNRVHLAMLFVIEKNNAKAFQVWNYFGKLIGNTEFMNRVMANPSFTNFKNEFSQVID